MTQQFVIQSRGDATENGMTPLGTRDEVARDLLRFNTSTDGLDPDALYGPGIRIDLPPAEPGEPVRQMLLTLVEEEIGWLVVQKLAREFNWSIVDTTSGRQWNP